TTFPSLMGFVNEILSTEAVTTGALQCLLPASAAAISIQYINLPPIKFSNKLVSFGNTSSVITTKLSDGFFTIIKKNFCKDTFLIMILINHPKPNDNHPILFGESSSISEFRAFNSSYEFIF